MNENITTGDILQMHDTQCTKGTGTTMSTVLGIIGAVIVLALLWNAYTRARDTRANTEAIASGALGTITGTVNGIQEELRAVKNYERGDAIKLAYTDGALWGRPCSGPAVAGHGFVPGYGFGYPGYPVPGYPVPGFGYHGHGGCCDKDCAPKQQFKEVRTFTEDTDTIQVVSACGPNIA